MKTFLVTVAVTERIVRTYRVSVEADSLSPEQAKQEIEFGADECVSGDEIEDSYDMDVKEIEEEGENHDRSIS